MSLRVLGVDPGLTRCGVGVVEIEKNRVARLVMYTVIRTPSDMELSQRLLRVGEGIDELLDEHRPDAVALERVFAQNNVGTVMGTAQVSGVVIHAAARRRLPVALHTPTEVKAAVTGYGAADKRQVATMVKRVLGLDVVPTPADAADALALAICSAWRHGGAGAIDRGGVRESAEGNIETMTPAQRAWRAAEKSQRMPGVGFKLSK